METRTILISGGSGFIGRSIAEALIKKGHRVRILTRQKREGQNFLAGDITKPETLRGACDES